MIIRLSHDLNDFTPSYGNQKDNSITIRSSILSGDSSNSLTLNFSNHWGTHVDCPFHFDPDGKKLTDYTEDEWIFNKVQLMKIEAKHDQILTPSDLTETILPDTEVLLIKSGFEKERMTDSYWKNNPGLSPSLGNYIRSTFPQLKVLGLDFISITSFSQRELGRIAHKSFLNCDGSGEPLRVIEDMKISALKNSPSKIIIAPLFIKNADAAPVTIFAETN